MSYGITRTGYSITFGGAKGYVNIGGWNTTLTDVSATAQETVGIRRQEGANEYMYVQFGTAAVASQGLFWSVSTAYSDTNGYIPPIALTANGTVSTGTIARGMNVATTIASGTRYGWVLVRGIATGYMMTDSGVTQGGLAGPSTSTANLLDGGTTALTAVARALETVATATAQVGSAGSLYYWNFKTMGNP